ncbi:MAG TPA: hypothetical protein VMS21_08025, partial [Methylomirabilota bacterium]|nr:hypothetical protein [Methylomirabilota bacterium]
MRILRAGSMERARGARGEVKIPKAVLARCEWGRDDYSLKVENLRIHQLPAPRARQQQLLGVTGASA